MTIPIQPPIAPMLAKLARELPQGEGWSYEPKWDGFRAIVFRDGGDVYIQSRDLKPFVRYFPELAEALGRELPERCVVDGEIVIATADGLEFDALQMRIHPAESRIRMLAKETPSSFVAFDMLAFGDEDLRATPFVERRERLVKELDGGRERMPKDGTTGSQILITPSTEDPDEADAWFEGLAKLGLEGVVAKRGDLGYQPGQRVMVKVKRLKTLDVVVGGYRIHKSGDGVGSLVLGLYDDHGVMHFVGVAASFTAKQRRELLEQVKPYEGEDPFGMGRIPGGQSRWSQGKDLTFIGLRPELVAEVNYDKMQGDRIRHVAHFLHWRTDKRPEECTYDQIA
jgi:ATP-dependent DNA ligase